ncbi:MAG: hypothetical protein ACK4UL_05455, partial [Novosphingobium meiothermophilum]
RVFQTPRTFWRSTSSLRWNGERDRTAGLSHSGKRQGLHAAKGIFHRVGTARMLHAQGPQVLSGHCSRLFAFSRDAPAGLFVGTVGADGHGPGGSAACAVAAALVVKGAGGFRPGCFRGESKGMVRVGSGG